MKKPLSLNVLLLVVALFLHREPCSAQLTKNLPNIVYILADDMGYGDIKAFNSNAQTATPNLDKLCKEGMSFTDAHSGSAVCTPTRYGILTGRYAFRSSLKKGVLNGYSPALIENDRITIADVAKAAGYQTGVVGKWHLGLDWATSGTAKQDAENVLIDQPLKNGPNNLGFDYSFILPASLDMPPYTFLENGQVIDKDTVHSGGSPEKARGIFWRAGKAAKSFDIYSTLDVIVDKAKSYIETTTHVKKPFFLYVPLTAPHTPWLPGKAYRTSGAGTYGDFVQHTDAAVGRLLQCLDSLGLSSNTLIIFTSDNGADWKDKDKIAYPLHQANYVFRGEKSDLWEGGHHIPFIAKWPNYIKAGEHTNETICLTDFMATLASLTNQKLPAKAGPDSYDFLTLLKGKNAATRESIIHHSIDGMFAIRKGKWKFIDGSGSGGWSMKMGNPGDPAGQLYDLDNDISETKNLYDQYPEIVKELKALLEKYKNNGL